MDFMVLIQKATSQFTFFVHIGFNRSKCRFQGISLEWFALSFEVFSALLNLFCISGDLQVLFIF